MTEHYILFGNAAESLCICGAVIPSNPAAVEAHMYPLTPAELEQLGLTDGDNE